MLLSAMQARPCHFLTHLNKGTVSPSRSAWLEPDLEARLAVTRSAAPTGCSAQMEAEGPGPQPHGSLVCSEGGEVQGPSTQPVRAVLTAA